MTILFSSGYGLRTKLVIFKLFWTTLTLTQTLGCSLYSILYAENHFEKENCGRMEIWEDGKYLVFPLVCLVGGVENI